MRRACAAAWPAIPACATAVSLADSLAPIADIPVLAVGAVCLSSGT